MTSSTKLFYQFLSACRGNWRNSIYITCGGPDHPGYLLSADRDGKPMLMPITQFQQLTGEQIDPTECCGQLSGEAFRCLYAQYLLWQEP